MFGPKQTVLRSDVTVHDQVSSEHLLDKNKKWAEDFVNGTGPLSIGRANQWKKHALVALGLLVFTVFMNRATATFWDRSGPAIAAFMVLVGLTLVWLAVTWFSYTARNEPALPTDLTIGEVRTIGRTQQNQTYTYTVAYQLASGKRHRTESLGVGNQVRKGQRVLVLHFGPTKAFVL